jgi:hypothetical protein
MKNKIPLWLQPLVTISKECALVFYIIDREIEASEDIEFLFAK